MPLRRNTPKGFALDVRDVCFIEVIQNTCKHRETSGAVITRDSGVGEQISHGLGTLLEFVLFEQRNSSVEVSRKPVISFLESGHLERV